MGMCRRILGGGDGGFFSQDWKVDATTVSGAVALRSTSTSSAGEVVDATTTGFVNAIGCYGESVTYTATPVAGNNQVVPKPTTIEGVVRIITHPFALWEFNVSGAAAAGTALTTLNILTNSTADATKLIVSDVNVSTISFVGGLIKGRTGANKGQTRRIITHNNNADERVEVAFTNAIAANDTFIRVPYSKAVIAGTLCTDLTELRGDLAIAGGTINVYTVRIGIDDIAPGRDVVLLEVMFRDHLYNALA